MSAPDRVVSLSPNVSMILFALGADELVVGRTEYCLPAIQHYVSVWELPPSTATVRLQHWSAIPVVGVWPLADAEPIRALQPDLILTSGSGAFGVHDAQGLGVSDETLAHFDTRTFADLDAHIARIGALIGQTEAAADLIAQLAMTRDAATAKLLRLPVTPTVLFEYCVCTTYAADPEQRVADPARTILVGGHLAPDLIQLCGGQPLFARPGDTAAWVTVEQMQASPPDIILQYDCHGCPVARQFPISARRGWANFPAVNADAVVPLRENISDPNLCFPAPLSELIDIFNHQGASLS